MRLLANVVVQVFTKKTINHRDALMDDTGRVYRWCFEREMGRGFVRHVIDVRKKLTLRSGKA